ncbi:MULTISPECIES: hypothetical protein [unclassified Tolypothrix]|uniref:hypothetical protein n=1 Tax=unclassified Tolypothrix TaxID=2649714 RepID=UPI0005EAAFA6|nr:MULTISPECIES: hypothetical protein [unclassified Tolypothrix]BAY88826.1 hypothetical protein NIES3275_08260 [Microchaete diplosiphon NIES-3275]EKF02761.1 hypothetical protein FDUTEX481_05561 [Tolypothrix sp. PCC 7601]MBE9083759.1 hypothetical protein [Tolypothrix sp. LEGE 11397]UYD29474.1 hypothetical protein HGR01_16495 [Tolypothrix sp. PCC 7712]UYD34614.1 hypothetical protein HG267_01810 [Tolypothrix sp. PCC 7601]
MLVHENWRSPTILCDRYLWDQFFIPFLPTTEIQQLGKIQRRSGVPGAGCVHLDQAPQVFLPVPGTSESRVAFRSCVNLPCRAFLLTIA